MLKRKSALSLSLFSVIVIVVLALSFSLITVQAQDAPVPTATPIVSELGTGGTHISFWNGLTGSDGVTLNEMLTQFVAENPDLSVTTEIVDWNTLYPKLQTAFVAGQPPDVFLLHASEIPQFANFGVLMDLSSWYTSGGGWFPDEDLAPSTYNGMSFNGVLYGIPLDNHGRGQWANLDAFERAGVDPNTEPPTTYEGWVDLFQRLTLDVNGNNAQSPDFDPANVAQWGTAMSEWPYVNYFSTLAQNGGRMVSEDGTTATVNSPEAVAALQQLVDLIYTYNVSAPQAGFDPWQSWAGGTVALVPTGTWFRNFAVDQTDISWAAWPQWQFGEQPATWFGAHTFMLPNSLEGDKLEAVQRMIQWISENQVAWAASGQVPARLSAQEVLDPENYPSNILLGETFTEYGVMEIQHVAILEIQAAIDPEISAALNGQKTPQQALDDANARIQAILDRNQ
jgi:ABC-type glycerol-3-phosphate transport system substrate-binding protein